MAVGKVNVGGEGTVKFAKVTASLTPPPNPNIYDIWLECNDILGHINFDSNSTFTTSVGDVIIGISDLTEVLRSSISGASNSSLSYLPKVVPAAANKRIMTSKWFDIYANEGSAKVMRSDGVYHYVNGYVYDGTTWVQFSVAENVGFMAFYKYSAEEGTTRRVAIYDNTDYEVSTTGAIWGNETTTSAYAYPHGGLYYHPIHKRVYGVSTNNYTYKIDPSIPLNSTSNYVRLTSPGSQHDALAITRKYLIYVAKPSSTYSADTILKVLNLDTGFFEFEGSPINAKKITNNKHTNADRVKYVDKYGILIGLGIEGDYNDVNIIDINAMETSGTPVIIASVTGYAYGSASSPSLSADKEGLATFYSLNHNSFIQINRMGIEVRKVSAANLRPYNTTSYSIYSIKQDQYGNFYMTMYQVGALRKLVKTDKDFNILWEVLVTNSAGSPYIGGITKEGIIYVVVASSSTDATVRKYNSSGQLLNTITHPQGMNFAVNPIPFVTWSPDIAAFPEYW